MQNDLIPLKDYAALHGVTDSTLRHRIRSGLLPEAVKLAGSWFIPRDLPFIDHRTKGNSKRWAKDNSTEESAE